ncbi:cytochrome d ubiquinol oxidase subunit II [Methylomarinum sp. Ch1-1]|uniref:Cytochrome d ubiquinol oxidase subunit II n=1 Tax=Methylomarinum roseum TaxID=3067653 RepID=A0AAU7NWZ4_9GAMM|nr:cytochrome d ubiquinol oxidase subunit II [Methylomarinum sp. Ch1-1]MDP4522413.1 cytochrome d ubiquinol oxidase subunit II [Methylomarinum sp. Ch1-1]
MIFDYETLRIIWWAFLGALLIGFAVTDGFDLGVAMLLPYLGKSDDERRVIINSVGPTWEGNQVWFITAGGALFAAWPMAYAVSFSGMYFALFATLVALFLRPLGFDYRGKLPDQNWRNNWDKALFVGGLVPALIMGVGFGNLLKGIPFHLDSDMRIFYLGTFRGLLNPFALLAGVLSVSMFLMHGAVYLQLRTDAEIYQRAKSVVLKSSLLVIVLFALGGLWITHLEGYHITSEIFPNAPSNPLNKFVKRAEGLWLDNYNHVPALWGVPAAAFVGALATIALSRFDRPGWGLLTSSLTLTAIILTAGVSMFPFLIPSNMSLNSSLTVWDSSSSQATLNLMFWVTVIFLPLIVIYTSWVFRVLRGKITVDFIRDNDHKLY